MPLDDILAAMRAEADAELEDIRSTSDATVAAITAEAHEEALEAERAAASSRDPAADREFARIVNRADLEATRQLRNAIELAWQEALETLRGRLGAIRSTPAYRDVLARLLDEGLDMMPDATVVRVDPDDAELIRPLLEERRHDGLGLDATLPCLGGVELITDDGRAVRNTFESRLARADGRLRRLAAEQLPDRDET